MRDWVCVVSICGSALEYLELTAPFLVAQSDAKGCCIRRALECDALPWHELLNRSGSAVPAI